MYCFINNICQICRQALKNFVFVKDQLDSLKSLKGKHLYLKYTVSKKKLGYFWATANSLQSFFFERAISHPFILTICARRIVLWILQQQKYLLLKTFFSSGESVSILANARPFEYSLSILCLKEFITTFHFLSKESRRKIIMLFSQRPNSVYQKYFLELSIIIVPCSAIHEDLLIQNIIGMFVSPVNLLRKLWNIYYCLTIP